MKSYGSGLEWCAGSKTSTEWHVWHVPGTSDNLHIHPNVVKILWSQLSGDGQLASITLWQTNITMENHYF